MNAAATTPAPPSYEQCAAAARAASTDPCDGAAVCTRCLQTWGCMIDSYGYCVTQGYDDYNKYADFTLAATQGVVLPGALAANRSLLTNRQYWHFRASDATYCNRSDTVCQQCATAKFWTEGRFEDRDSRYCRGADGCVCIFNCEDVGSEQCTGWTPAPPTALPSTEEISVTPSPADSNSDEKTWTGSTGVDLAVKLVLILVLVATPLIVGYRRWEKRKRQQLKHDGYVATVPTLDQHQDNGRSEANLPPHSLPVEP